MVFVRARPNARKNGALRNGAMGLGAKTYAPALQTWSADVQPNPVSAKHAHFAVSVAKGSAKVRMAFPKPLYGPLPAFLKAYDALPLRPGCSKPHLRKYFSKNINRFSLIADTVSNIICS